MTRAENSFKNKKRLKKVRQYHPRRRRARWLVALELSGALGCLSHPLDLVAEVAEVVLADGYGKDFVDHGREVSQGSNRRQRRVVETEPAGAGRREPARFPLQ